MQLGYAATAHGDQGDAVDVSLTLVTAATTLRSLYVGATRVREENRLVVVTPTDEDARDVLERVLAIDRVDVPAVAQRRVLTEQARGSRADSTDSRERALARARRALEDARQAGECELRALGDAAAALEAAEAEVRSALRALRDAPRLRRRGPAERVKAAETAFATAADRHAKAAHRAEPYAAAIEARLADIEQAERTVRWLACATASIG